MENPASASDGVSDTPGCNYLRAQEVEDIDYAKFHEEE
jgi:hypothetical protein